ncbi:MAG: hypothetical protein QM783_08060 [Phycisphaerales bacterium]
MVLKLLPLGRAGAEQSAVAVEQVGPGEEEVPVDQEVLLLGAEGGDDACHALVGAEDLQDAHRLTADRLH